MDYGHLSELIYSKKSKTVAQLSYRLIHEIWRDFVFFKNSSAIWRDFQNNFIFKKISANFYLTMQLMLWAVSKSLELIYCGQFL